MTDDALTIEETLYCLLVSGIMQDHNSYFILIEGEALKVINVAFTVTLLPVSSRHFAEERLFDSDPKASRSVAHHIVALIGLIIVLLGIDHSPLLFLKVRGLSVFDFSTCVVIPASLPSIGEQRWRVEHFTSDLMFFSLHLDVKISELLSLHQPIDYFNDSVEALGWV